jgi:hypothetical protein
MANHENKNCPRCGGTFECKVGSILLCQCNGLAFTEQEWDYIRFTYTDCLCRKCLQVMKHEISTSAVQEKMKTILGAMKRKT